MGPNVKHATDKRFISESLEQSRLTTRIAAKLIRVQENWAAYMQRKSEGLSRRAKICLLIAFCLVASGYSIYVSVWSFANQGGSDISIQSIRMPEQIDDNRVGHGVQIEFPHYKLERFLHYMDSLAQRSSGRKTHDSILKRPSNWTDSVGPLEDIHHLQSSKK